MTDRRDRDAGSEIILSAADPHMPVHLAGDGDSNAMVPDSPTPADAPENGAATGRRGPLALLRMPEQWLWRHYLKSRLHRYLHRSCSWYQELEEDLRLGGKLERLYAAGSRPRYRLQRFVTGNLAATVLIGLFAAQAGRAGIDALVQAPAPTRAEPAVTAVALERPASATSAVTAAAQRRWDADLDHCSLSSQLRSALADADPATRHAAMREIERFQARYAASGIELRWRRHLQRRQLSTRAALGLLPVVARYQSRLRTARSRLQSQRAQLAGAMAAANSPTAHDVARINQRITLRDALDRIDSALAAGPSSAQLAALGEAVDSLARYATADARAPRPAGGRTGPSAWAVKARNMGAEQLGLELESLLQRDIREPIAARSSGSSTLDRYRVDTVTAAIVSFNQLLAMQQQTALDRPTLEREQADTNHRLSSLLALPPAAALLDYRDCLDQLPVATQLSAGR